METTAMEILEMNKIRGFVEKHFKALLIVAIIIGIGLIFYIFKWWEAIGLFVLKFGLGIKTAGAKSFAVAVAKSGGKKALMLTTGGVLLKRFIIDTVSAFITEHSVSRYKKNVGLYLKYQIKRLIASTWIQKIKGIILTLTAGWSLQFVVLKVIGSMAQKVLYAVFASLVSLISSSMNFVWNVVSFFIQVKLLGMFIDFMEKYQVGKDVIKYAVKLGSIIGRGFNWVNATLVKIGFDPKHWLIKHSIRFNRYIELKIYKDRNAHQLVQVRRKIHINDRELIYCVRAARVEARIKQPSNMQKVRELYRLKILRKKTWQEKRAERIKVKEKRSGLSLYRTINQKRIRKDI